MRWACQSGSGPAPSRSHPPHICESWIWYQASLAWLSSWIVCTRYSLTFWSSLLLVCHSSFAPLSWPLWLPSGTSCHRWCSPQGTSRTSWNPSEWLDHPRQTLESQWLVSRGACANSWDEVTCTHLLTPWLSTSIVVSTHPHVRYFLGLVVSSVL